MSYRAASMNVCVWTWGTGIRRESYKEGKTGALRICDPEDLMLRVRPLVACVDAAARLDGVINLEDTPRECLIITVCVNTATHGYT